VCHGSHICDMTHSLICDANNSLNFDITDSRTHRYTKSEMSVEAEMNTFFSKLDTDNSGSITDVQFQVRVAVCCSVLQRVAACCSVLQRVAACCSVWHTLFWKISIDSDCFHNRGVQF